MDQGPTMEVYTLTPNYQFVSKVLIMNSRDSSSEISKMCKVTSTGVTDYESNLSLGKASFFNPTFVFAANFVLNISSVQLPRYSI